MEMVCRPGHRMAKVRAMMAKRPIHHHHPSILTMTMRRMPVDHYGNSLSYKPSPKGSLLLRPHPHRHPRHRMTKYPPIPTPRTARNPNDDSSPFPTKTKTRATTTNPSYHPPPPKANSNAIKPNETSKPCTVSLPNIYPSENTTKPLMSWKRC